MPELQTSTSNLESKQSVGQVAVEWHENPLEQEQQYRAAAYGMLAALLRDVPDAALLDQVSKFVDVDEGGDEMALSMSLLGLAAKRRSIESINDEYHALFIGIGRGELVPYGSFYLTGFLMEKPLGDLRDDLDRLGFEREVEVHEPEDHVAALCEVMAMLIQDGSSIDTQRGFFTTHINSWFQQFFTEMSAANNAVFYKAVSRFGSAFLEIEKRYLSVE
ncbi:MAG: molecular chaperone TorD family protein [Gammaproteobacteria bacterium]|nr:molecular chaperone TorD family protein [Gammaproteobacteria bacterium]MDX2488061.1 molecular chaperone TorD family protein [Gammaproteobacteria bacterium]